MINENNNTNYPFSNFEKEEITEGAPVYLKVYNVTSINSFFKLLGLGVYHTSILVYGVEYGYGSSPEGTSGIIEMTEGMVKISGIWQGTQYHPYRKNCNHFTLYFSRKLLRSSVEFPYFINKFSKFQTIFKCFFKPLKTLV